MRQMFSSSTMVELLRGRAAHQSERHAYTFLVDGETEGVRLTYGELNQKARAIAAMLQNLGATGERALLLYPPGLEFIAAFFGCLYAGVVAVPAYPPRPNRSMSRIQGVVVDAQATVALTTTYIFSDLERRFTQTPELKALRWLKSDQVPKDLGESWQAPAVKGETLAYLQYTSGSTFTPKGVMVSHENVLHNSECIKQAFELTPDSVSVSWLPHFHDMGLVDGIIQPLYTGFPGLLMPPVSFLQQPIRWLEAISRYRATHCGGPNFAYELCVDKITLEQRQSLDLSSWCSAYNGAEPVCQSTLERFAAAFKPCGFRASFLYTCYGLAETTLMVSGGEVKDEPVYCRVRADALEQNRVVEASRTAENVRQLVGCGRSGLDTKIVIAEPESLMLCVPDQVGEIWVSGSSVAQGYWNRPEQTKQTFRAYLADTGEGPFLRTGDLGFLRDGELFVTGRLKELVIIRGRNHYPQDIELTVEQSHPALRPGCGAALAVEVDGEERVVIVQEVERSYLRKLNVEEVAGAIRQAVAQQHELQVYAVVLLKTGRIPKTSSGKIQRHVCRSGFMAETLDEVGRSVLEDWDEVGNEMGLTRERLLVMAPEECLQRLVDYLREQVLRVLKVAPSQLDSQQPLSQLGLDSLMTVELKHQLEADLGVVVSMVDFLQGTSVLQLATQVLAQLRDSSSQPSTALVSASEQVAEYPLSHGQQALWFLHQLAPESAAYNVFFAVRILSDLDVAALKQAFQVLTARYPALRNTFTTLNGQPEQQIQEQLEVAFKETDASTWSLDELNGRLVESAHCPFDLEQEPLMRVGLFRRWAGEHILLLTVHHIAIDFWSLVVLMDELRVLYPALKASTTVSLPPLDWQYADYVRWQADMLAGSEGERLWSYWQKQLAGELPVLNLPTDRPQSPVQTYRGAAQAFQLDQELTGRLKTLAQAEGATLYMTLLAAFQVLLYRYTGQEDILVGSPAAGRSRAELAGMVGYLVNPVVLRADVSGNPTFKAFLGQVRQTVLGALAHQDYPFPLLVQRLQPERDSSYLPLFQVMFVLEKPHRLEELAPFVLGETGVRMNLGGLELESLALEQRVAQFDLTLMMVEVEGGLAASWQYNTDLFDEATISRMAGHFQTLLEGIVAEPEQCLSDLPLLTAAKRRQLLVEWNDTQVDYPGDVCIHQLFEAQVERTPDAVAVVFEDEQLTYRELNRQANQLAHYLQGLGVGPKVLVGICVERSLEMVVGLLGILKSGGAYVPLDPAYPKERLAFMLSDSQVQVILTQKKLMARLPEHRVPVVCLDSDWEVIERNSEGNPSSGVGEENLVYVIYTSGSTGWPKGVAIEHRQILNYLNSILEHFDFPSGSSFATVSTLAADLGNTVIFPSLCTGGQLHVLSWERASNPDAFADYLSNHPIDYLKIVPSHLVALQNPAEPGRVLPRKGLILGGEASRPDWVESLLAIAQQCTIFNHYGPTETTVGVLTYRVEREQPLPKTQALLLGRPLANVQIYLLDAQLNPVPIGIPGEIYVGGAGVARGYLNRPDLTAEKFIPNPYSNQAGGRLYKTGDLARYLPDGNIEFLGRVDDQVKVRGFRVELKDIETVLCQHPDVREATVMAWEDQPGNGRLVAYVVPKKERSPTISGRRRYKLPNNLAVAHLNKNETDYIYKEIFELKAYLRHGITINKGDCIFDVGANIGLFTLFTHQIGKHTKVYSFEPNPAVFKILKANASLYGLDAHLFNCGLSDKQKTATFTYFPGFSLLSGFYANAQTEREVVKKFLLNQQNRGEVEMTDLIAQADEILEGRFKAETFTAKLVTLSSIIEEQNIERIDLLKINVEKSELDVLAGIKEKDWSKIRQIVLEVDTKENLEPIISLLERHGYEFVVEQDVLLADTQLCYIYAIRSSAQGALIQEQEPGTHIKSLPVLDDPVLSSSELKRFMKDNLPDYMVPSAFVLLESLPLTPNGKVDRRALPGPEGLRPELEAAYVIPQTEAERLIAAVWQEMLQLEKVGIHDNFFDLGGHSLLMVQIHSKLLEIFDQELSMVEMFKYPTIHSLAKHLSQKQSEQPSSQPESRSARKASNNSEIAIIGMSCRFPGAKDIDAFWQNLRDGVESISFFSEQELVSSGIDPAKLSNPNYVKASAVLSDIELFDASFFGFSPREAEMMDPQHRLFLECAWEAIESAGYNVETYEGAIGVYGGAGINTYLHNNLHPNFDLSEELAAIYQAMIANEKDFLTTRISYKLNLKGPSVNVQTACSTSLVAVHLACQSLLNGECDMALAGGVSVRVPQKAGYLYEKGMILSPDGHCRAFDAQAQGTVFGNGVGIVVLKRLTDAIADGDCIHAIIKGSAINNDGSSKVGYTAPSVDGQGTVISKALVRAGIEAETVTYVEAHGTGTALGDSIEIAALTQAFRASTRKKGFCAISSVKTNVGHLDAAASVTGLIKTVLALKHKLLPPTLHFEQPNPQIDWANSPFYVKTKLSEWKTGGTPRRAGVSSFGLGGTNAHVILEEAPETAPVNSNIERAAHLLTLSAKSEKALLELAQRYEDFLASQEGTLLADVCFTANTGRSDFPHRLAVVAESIMQLREQLGAFVAGKQTAGLVSDSLTTRKYPKVAFLFTGQGSQYVGMGHQLYDPQPIFRQTLDRCDEILRPYLEKPLLQVLYPKPGEDSPLDETAYTQPALFALEYALAELWKSWGIEPAVVMGHSVGEYVAACVAGVFSLEDGLKLVAERGRLMQALAQDGEMVAVFADEGKVQAAIKPYAQDVAIAAVNSRENIVISCVRQAVESVVAALEAEGVETKKLKVSHAFHSPLMEPMLAAFERVAADVAYSSPRIGLISNVTGELVTAEIATSEYWCRHIRQPVRFAASMETLHQQGYEIFVEIGPKPTLLGMGRHCLPNGVGVWLPSLRQGHSDWQHLLQSLGELYVRGVPVDWFGFERDYPRRRVVLPTYPFQRQRYWLETAENRDQKAGVLSQEHVQTPILNLLNQGDTEQLARLLGKAGNFSEEQMKFLPELLSVLVKQHQQQVTAASIKDWLYQVEWQPKPRQLKTALEGTQTLVPGSWLILADQGGVGQALAELLQERGQNCILVYAGDAYKTEETGTWSLKPSSPGDFELLLQEALGTLKLPLQGVVHLWSLEAALAEELTIPSLEQAQTLGCGSGLHLVQALVKHKGPVSPRLWLVTRGAMPVGHSLPAVAQAPLWGLGKVVALEHPELWGGMLDLAPEVSLDDEAATLLAEIWDSEGEDHLAFREGQRYVARLVRSQLPESQGVPLRSDGTYLITGGLGALGLRVARWIVEQGARHLVLTGRRGASSQAQETLNQLEQAGAKVLVAKADVSNQGDMVRVLEEVKATMLPLRGIVHAAGVVDDGTLQSQNWEGFTRVMASKVEGTWNLHTLTQKLPLDFFVLFSSGASLLGSPGQGNYAAANAFMDALAYHRQGLGLPGLTINWGQWAEAGMAASLGSRYHARFVAQGIRPIAPEQGLQVLERILGSVSAQVGVLAVEWSVFRQQLSAGNQLPLLSELVHEVGYQETAEQTSAQRHELLQRLEEAQARDRQEILIDYIQGEVAKVLGFEQSRLPDPQQGFSDMGMDSLMAVELRNRLESSLGSSLPSTLVFKYPTIKDLAEYLAREISGGESPATADVELHKGENQRSVVLSEIKQLSEDEVEASIEEEVKKLKTLLKGEN